VKSRGRADVTISRRGLLKAAGITLGASAVSGVGLSRLAGEAPKAAEPAAPDFAYGKDKSTGNRVFVGYATRTGSTVGVASAIGETLGGRGFAVDVKPMKSGPSLDGYDAVVLGSAVNGGRWLPEAVEFVKANQATLSHVPVAVFCVHIMNLGNDEQSRKNRLAYLDAVRPLVSPLEEAFFAGLGSDPNDRSFGAWVFRTLKVGPEGDCRDWNLIRGWARTVLA
jgi:menaquinone-dependent protoporphyrinogen oxidase